MTYNGWSNYETWVAGMFLDGNYDGEGTYRAVLEIVERHAESDELDVYTLATALGEFVEESLPELGGLAGDLLRAAVSEINWLELAEMQLSAARS